MSHVCDINSKYVKNTSRITNRIRSCSNGTLTKWKVSHSVAQKPLVSTVRPGWGPRSLSIDELSRWPQFFKTLLRWSKAIGMGFPYTVLLDEVSHACAHWRREYTRCRAMEGKLSLTMPLDQQIHQSMRKHLKIDRITVWLAGCFERS